MKQEAFIDSFQELFPGCGREAAQGWIDFATENVEQEQYVNFIPEPNQAAAVEKWLDTLYAGLYQAKQEFGTEVASQICNMPLSQNHCFYPWEMKEAAAYLQSGGDLNNISQLSVDGELDSGAPFFPTLEDTHHQEQKAAWKPVSDEQRESRLQRQENYLKTAEMGMEQNYNQLDGIINNEPPRINQGYTIIDSEIVGHKEFVLAESPTAPQPYVTWARNIQNDEQTGSENFFWGHYFTDPDRAREDLHTRADEERESLKDCRPSILSQLKSDAPRKDLPTAPQPGHKKDAPER